MKDHPIEERFIPTREQLLEAWIKVNHPVNVPEKIEYELGFHEYELAQDRTLINYVRDYPFVQAEDRQALALDLAVYASLRE